MTYVCGLPKSPDNLKEYLDRQFERGEHSRTERKHGTAYRVVDNRAPW